MQDLKDLLDYLKRNRFLKNFCGIDPNGGITHWIVGKPTNQKAKKTSIDEGDKAKIKAGWDKFVGEGNEIIDKTCNPNPEI